MSGFEINLGQDFKRKWKAAVRAVEEWTDDLHDAVEDVVEEYAEKVFDTATKEVPVDTGNLRSTIEQILMDGAQKVTKALVGTEKTTYAAYQEFGTTIHEAQPYLRPALKKHAEDFVRAVADAVQDHADNASSYK
jgi:HK97 gp10 family phage protein